MSLVSQQKALTGAVGKDWSCGVGDGHLWSRPSLSMRGFFCLHLILIQSCLPSFCCKTPGCVFCGFWHFHHDLTCQFRLLINFKLCVCVHARVRKLNHGPYSSVILSVMYFFWGGVWLSTSAALSLSPSLLMFLSLPSPSWPSPFLSRFCKCGWQVM